MERLAAPDGVPGPGPVVSVAEFDLTRPADLFLETSAWGKGVAWVNGCHAGVNFAQKLNPDQLLRHIPTPRPRVTPEYKRTGLRGTLTAEERRYGETWVWRFPADTD